MRLIMNGLPFELYNSNFRYPTQNYSSFTDCALCKLRHTKLCIEGSKTYYPYNDFVSFGICIEFRCDMVDITR